MLLMGCDLASYKSGIFVLDTEKILFKSTLIHVKNPDMYVRIREFKDKVSKLLELYKPDLIIIESTFLDEFRKYKQTKKRGNVNTLKTLEKFHGAFLSQTKDYMDIHYMSPGEHKTAMTGIGHAGKQATIYSVQRKLGLVNMGEDEADAAALVLSYLIQKKQWDILEAIKDKYEV